MSNTAALWAGWDRYRGSGTPSPFNADTADELSPKVELYLGGQWVDITRTSQDQAGVYYRDAITISRGRADEASTADPQTCSFTLNNREGRFSLYNPMSPYYGLLSRNTPVRVSVLQNGVRRYRFHGEISAWPSKSDISGQDVYVPVQASGIKRRLQQGSSPIKSAVYRDMTSSTRASIVGYWPLEDAAGSTSIASGLAGAPAMKITAGAADFGSYSDWFGSDALPSMGTAVTHAVVPAYVATGETSIRFFCKVNTAVPATYQELIRWKTTGTASVWWLSLKSDGSLRMISKDVDGNTLLDSTDSVFGMNTAGLRTLTIEMTETSGGDIDWRVLSTDFANGLPAEQGFDLLQITDTVAGATVGRITDVILGTNGGLGEVVLGHVSIANDLTAYTGSGRSLVAWNDEDPRDRIRRLCREEGISQIDIGTSGNSTLLSDVSMGSQHSGTLITLLEDCGETDLGILYEPRDQIGLAYRTRAGLYNQAVRLALDHSAHELADALNPVIDDQKIVNDLTISRQDGSSARQVLESGPMSVLDPPDGIGRYDSAPPALSLGSDDQLANQVGWRLLLGTVDEARYPSLALNLRHSSFASSVDLMNAAMVMDVGDRITISNPPSWLPPDMIDLVVQGYQETFDQCEYNITVNCAPGSPYQVGFADDDVYGRADTDGSALAADIDASTSTISVATTAGPPIWTTDPADFPFDVRYGGEVATVTAISGTSSPQTFTVTRSVNGVTKPHLAGTDVRLAHPTIVSL